MVTNMVDRNYPIISMTLPPRLLELLNQHTKRVGKSRSSVISEAIAIHLGLVSEAKG